MKKEKYVNKDWLEAQVAQLNAELYNFHHDTEQRQRLQSLIAQYISKLEELERGKDIYVKIDL